LLKKKKRNDLPDKWACFNHLFVAWRYILVMMAFAASLTACAPASFQELLAAADQLASSSNLKPLNVNAGKFVLRAYARITDSSQPASLYIEGDGKAWITRNRLSPNPTPQDPIALKLAAADSVSGNIIYLARPCHYQSKSHYEFQDWVCTPEYWTSHRYGEAVIKSINAAIDQLKTQYQLSTFNLIGYSGGGALAVLVAARRKDVSTIRTVAGNLHIDQFVELHMASALRGSINPVSVANQIKKIPQLHFVGVNDKIVPGVIAQSYREQVVDPHCIRIVYVDDASHSSGWVSKWSDLLRTPLPCL
jgi:Serine hydrolase (FSH1)